MHNFLKHHRLRTTPAGAETASPPEPAAAKKSHGQSYLELALVLPVLLIMLLGLVEVSFYIASYLNGLDLTREAARFASVRDPFDGKGSDVYTVPGYGSSTCQDTDPSKVDFYYSTACNFSSPPACTNPNFCGGLNTYLPFNPDTDDIVISVFTVSNVMHNGSTTSTSVSTDQWPRGKKYWAYSEDVLGKAPGQGNWTKDCSASPVTVNNQPYFNQTTVGSAMLTGAVPTKGFVGVELYYCYKQVLGLPILTNFIPNPLRIHEYTLMPNPAAQPTDTPAP